MRLPVIIFLALFVSIPVYAGQTYTDGDLKKYPSDNKDALTTVKNNIDNDKKSEPEKKKLNIDKWCKKWINYKEDLDKAKKERDYTKSELNRFHLSNTYADQAIDKYRRAVLAVEDLEKQIADFEYKAYRASVPKLSYECEYIPPDYDEYDE